MKSKLSENLKKYRTKFNLTQGDLAEILNKDRTSIAKYESGSAQPPFNVLISLAKIYDITIDELCGIAPPAPLVFQSGDKPENDEFSALLSAFDKQEQIMILKIKSMDSDKKQEFMKILKEFIKD